MDYDEIRHKFRKNLIKQAIFFQQERNFNIINILFPHIWQQDPINTDPNYKEIIKKNRKEKLKF